MTTPRKSSRRQARPVRERKLALGYVRVSTTKQVDEGASLPAQVATLTDETARRGWDLEIVRDEGLSGKTLDRPGLQVALERLAAGDADVLVSVRQDRLSRSTIDTAMLLARAQSEGWNLVLLDLGMDLQTEAGEMVAKMLASVAEYERKLIARRTREGMRQRMAEGVVMGRPQEMCPNLRARIAAAAASGTAYAELARQLNDEGVPTPRGGRWHASTVRRAAITPDRVCRCSWDGELRVPAEGCPRHWASDRRLAAVPALSPQINPAA